MSQEEIAQKIERLARRLVMVMISSTRSHNLEKEMLIEDIKRLSQMLIA